MLQKGLSLKKACVSLIVLAALMGLTKSASAMDVDDCEVSTSRRQETPTSSDTEEKPSPPQVRPLNPAYRQFVQTNTVFVKTSRKKTKGIVLTSAFCLAQRLDIVDEVCPRLVHMVEEMGQDVCSLLERFVEKGMSFPEVEITALAIRDAGEDRHEICENAYSMLCFTGDPKVFSSEYIKVATECKESIRDILRLIIINELITKETHKSGTPLVIFTAINRLGKNKEKVCSLASRLVKKDDKTLEIIHILKSINKLDEGDDWSAICDIALQIQAKFKTKLMSKCIELASAFGEDWEGKIL